MPSASDLEELADNYHAGIQLIKVQADRALKQLTPEIAEKALKQITKDCDYYLNLAVTS